ncbi:MAG: hypothetical protein LBD35_03070, partial [Prevotellaceae bacterium]|nr:hypothetical protein [Prevotellaceae bacterium]
QLVFGRWNRLRVKPAMTVRPKEAFGRRAGRPDNRTIRTLPSAGRSLKVADQARKTRNLFHLLNAPRRQQVISIILPSC